MWGEILYHVTFRQAACYPMACVLHNGIIYASVPFSAWYPFRHFTRVRAITTIDAALFSSLGIGFFKRTKLWEVLRRTVWDDISELTQQDGGKTQDGRMTKKCRVRSGMHSLARHFFAILPSCCVNSLMTDVTTTWAEVVFRVKWFV